MQRNKRQLGAVNDCGPLYLSPHGRPWCIFLSRPSAYRSGYHRRCITEGVYFEMQAEGSSSPVYFRGTSAVIRYEHSLIGDAVSFEERFRELLPSSGEAKYFGRRVGGDSSVGWNYLVVFSFLRRRTIRNDLSRFHIPGDMSTVTWVDQSQKDKRSVVFCEEWVAKICLDAPWSERDSWFGTLHDDYARCGEGCVFGDDGQEGMPLELVEEVNDSAPECSEVTLNYDFADAIVLERVRRLQLLRMRAAKVRAEQVASYVLTEDNYETFETDVLDFSTSLPDREEDLSVDGIDHHRMVTLLDEFLND